MEKFVYKPRPVVSVKSKDRIRKALGRVRREQLSADPHVVRKGLGWIARAFVNGQPYETQIFPTKELAEDALKQLRRRAGEKHSNLGRLGCRR